MTRPRYPSPDPSRRAPSYQRGIAPNTEPTPDVEAPEFDYGSEDWELMHRVTRMVADRYGLSKGSPRLAKHDNEALKLYRSIKAGKPVADCYTRRYVTTGPSKADKALEQALNPLNWGNPPIG